VTKTAGAEAGPEEDNIGVAAALLPPATFGETAVMATIVDVLPVGDEAGVRSTHGTSMLPLLRLASGVGTGSIHLTLVTAAVAAASGVVVAVVPRPGTLAALGVIEERPVRMQPLAAAVSLRHSLVPLQGA